MKAAPNLPVCEHPNFKEVIKSQNIWPNNDLWYHFCQMNKYGFTVLSDTGLDNFDAIADEIRNEVHKEIKDRRQDVWRSNAAVRKLATAPKILYILRQLYGRRPIPFQTLNFLHGTEQPTHSDTIHFHCVPNYFMCGVWVALEDVTPENGSLHYYPESHRSPLVDLSTLGHTGSSYIEQDRRVREELYPEYERFVSEMMQGYERKEFYAKKGEVLIWSANLYHGGSPIEDKSKTRLSQVTHYYFENCLYYTPMMSDMALGADKVKWRKIPNILTGESERGSYNGIPVNFKLVHGDPIVYP